MWHPIAKRYAVKTCYYSKAPWGEKTLLGAVVNPNWTFSDVRIPKNNNNFVLSCLSSGHIFKYRLFSSVHIRKPIFKWAVNQKFQSRICCFFVNVKTRCCCCCFCLFYFIHIEISVSCLSNTFCLSKSYVINELPKTRSSCRSTTVNSHSIAPRQS